MLKYLPVRLRVCVSLSSVFQVDGLDYVYVVSKDNRVRRQQVILGATEGADLFVTGLDEKASVIVDGVKMLHENDSVVITDQRLGN